MYLNIYFIYMKQIKSTCKLSLCELAIMVQSTSKGST